MQNKNRLFVVALVFQSFLVVAAGATVNKSIRIQAGESVDRSLSSVNGGITIGAGADVRGDVSTVNGGITVEDDATTEDVSSVNGALRIGSRVTVDGHLESVNGGIRIGSGSTVRKDVETVNGGLDLRGGVIEGSVSTVNGGVEMSDGARIHGDLIIEENRGNGRNRRVLEIELRGKSVIEGDVDVRDDVRRVRVVLHDGSVVKGQVRGAELVQK